MIIIGAIVPFNSLISKSEAKLLVEHYAIGVPRMLIT